MHTHIVIWLSVLFLTSCAPTPTPIKLPTLAPAPTPATLLLVFDIVDEVTGQPVNAEITIRRERVSDGSQLEAERFYTGQHLEIDSPVDPDVRLFVLVEAKGYNDWEVGFRMNRGGRLTAPIRLKPIATPRPQGGEKFALRA